MYMVVGFTTTCAISAYHRWSCEFESHSWRGVLDTRDVVFVWLWLYGSCIYNYICNQYLSPLRFMVFNATFNKISVISWWVKLWVSNPTHGEVYSIQHYMIKFISDLGQVCGFLWVLTCGFTFSICTHTLITLLQSCFIINYININIYTKAKKNLHFHLPTCSVGR
jgi:hypothetical protein